MKKRLFFAGLLAAGGVAYYLNRRARAHKAALWPVQNFDIEKYLGKWYEIARLDYYFERNLSNTSAHYSLNRDGSVRVLNKGYNEVSHEYKESVGKARFAGDHNTGDLEVSFFGPFYSRYTVIALDQYKYALVAGHNLDYLWILSRETTIPDTIYEKYIEIAESLGYNTEKLVWVGHDHVAIETSDSLVSKAIHQLRKISN